MGFHTDDEMREHGVTIKDEKPKEVFDVGLFGFIIPYIVVILLTWLLTKLI